MSVCHHQYDDEEKNFQNNIQKLLRKIISDLGIIKTLGMNKVFEKMGHLITIFFFLKVKLYHNFIISLCLLIIVEWPQALSIFEQS